MAICRIQFNLFPCKIFFVWTTKDSTSPAHFVSWLGSAGHEGPYKTCKPLQDQQDSRWILSIIKKEDIFLIIVFNQFYRDSKNIFFLLLTDRPSQLEMPKSEVLKFINAHYDPMILKPNFQYFAEREVRKKIVTFNGPGPLGLADPPPTPPLNGPFYLKIWVLI